MSTPTVLLTATPDAVLDQAAGYLARHGWLPAGLYQPHSGCTRGCACHRTGRYRASIIGAIRIAVWGQPRWYLTLTDGDTLHDYTAAVEWLNTYLITYGHADRHASLFDWQTTDGRNLTDVCGALHAAADAYRNQHERRWAA